MNLNDLATVSGKGGLYKVVAPTRGGMILESLDEKKKKIVINMHAKVSILGEISLYTTSKDGSVPLAEVMQKIHEEFDGDIGISAGSDADELKSFMKFILPDYDDERLYVSDIKKVVNWYNILSQGYPEIFNEDDGDEEQLSD